MQGGREVDMGGVAETEDWETEDKRLEIGFVAAFLDLLSSIHDLLSLYCY
jgi:hypothetical protein